jgi:2-(1,2-epoxy-1,2-dihydrophenyl)acetyl-CoA isomerase
MTQTTQQRTQEETLHNIRMERAGAVGIITIDRPDRFNALDVLTAQDLRKAGLRFARDDSVRCVILAGHDRVFCSGADLKYIREHGERDDMSYLQPSGRELMPGYGATFKQILEYIHSAISEIRRAPKPFIAAVKGVAAAGGFGLAMCCDLVYASEEAVFEWAYGKTSLTGAESSTFFLPRLIGLRKTMELVLLNPRLSAIEARDMDLITGIFPRDSFDEDVLAVAQQLAAGPTPAYGIAKALINEASGVDRIDFHLDKELKQLSRIADTADFSEGLQAFFERRAPQFQSNDNEETAQ